MMKQILAKSAIVLACIASLVAAQEKKFDLYGFADARILGQWFDANNQSFVNVVGPEGVQFRLEHINLYGDFRPSSKIRVLTELGFHWQPHGLMSGFPIQAGQSTSTGETSLAIIPDGPTEIASVSVQRGWVDLLLNQYVNIRVGKMLTPVGIWNVDHGSPVLTTVRQPYMVGMTPIFPRWQYGLMYHGTAFLGDGDLAYKVFLGRGQSMRSIPTIKRLQDIAGGANIKLSIPVLSGFEFGGTVYTGMNSDWEIVNKKPFPTSGFTAQDFYFDQEFSFKTREIAVGGDLKLLPFDDFTIQSEVQYKLMKDYRDGAPADNESTMFGVYGLMSYKIRAGNDFSITPYALYENTYVKDQIYPDNDGNPYSLAPLKAPLPPLYASGLTNGIQTVLGGLNFNFFTNYTFKIEYARLMVEPGEGIEAFKPEDDNLNLHVINAQVAVAF